MVNISSIANTITNIDGVINDDASQIEALNVSLFWFLIKEAKYAILDFCVVKNISPFNKQVTVANNYVNIAINDGKIVDNAAQILGNMENISSNANTITDIDGDIHDNVAQIEALNVSCFFYLIKQVTIDT